MTVGSSVLSVVARHNGKEVHNINGTLQFKVDKSAVSFSEFLC